MIAIIVVIHIIMTTMTIPVVVIIIIIIIISSSSSSIVVFLPGLLGDLSPWYSFASLRCTTYVYGALILYLSKAPKGNGTRATGSKNPRAHYNLCFSLLGMVLRTWVWF